MLNMNLRSLYKHFKSINDHPSLSWTSHIVISIFPYTSRISMSGQRKRFQNDRGGDERYSGFNSNRQSSTTRGTKDGATL